MIVLAIILLLFAIFMITGAMLKAPSVGELFAKLFVAPVEAYKVLFLVGVACLIAAIVVAVIALIKRKQNGEFGKFDKKAAKYVRDLNGERKNIHWPTFKTVLKNTGVVFVICAFVAIIVAAIDFGLGALINWMV
ncbi:MAG: preprotein translocase subunit SecE [Clostridia bacterium]|nr:preprotein translocase subunit SecE [Clostridia bacterium]